MDRLEAVPTVGYIASGGNGGCYSHLYRYQLPAKGGGGVAGDRYTVVIQIICSACG